MDRRRRVRSRKRSCGLPKIASMRRVVSVVVSLTAAAAIGCDPEDTGPDDNGDEAAMTLAAGHSSTCVATRAGEVYCWGVVDEVPGVETRQTRPVEIPALSHTGVQSISLGDGAGCTAHQDGTARCWGKNGWGQLGDGSTDDHREPRSVESLRGVVAIETSGRHACAVVEPNDLKCWGRNSNRQVAADTAPLHPTPVVSEHRNVQVFDLGDEFSCVVSREGRPTCWGDPESGRLQVGGLDDLIRISLGSNNACAVRSDGSVHCWGSNHDGMLGSDEPVRGGPKQVPGLTDAIDVAVGGLAACALHRNGTVSCWGSPAADLLDTSALTVPPTRIPGIDSAVRLAVGWSHACVATKHDQILCWGRNDSGQLGDGTNSSSTQPLPIALP